MTNILLMAHILVAISSLVFAGSTVFATFIHNLEGANTSRNSMWTATVTAVVSGFMVSLIMHSPIAQTCMSSLALIATVSLSQAYKTYAFSKI